MGVVYDLSQVNRCAAANYKAQNDPEQGINQVKYAERMIARAGDIRELAGFSPLPHIELGTDALEDTLQRLGGGQRTVDSMLGCMQIHARASAPMERAFRALPQGFRLRRADPFNR